MPCTSSSTAKPGGLALDLRLRGRMQPSEEHVRTGAALVLEPLTPFLGRRTVRGAVPSQ